MQITDFHATYYAYFLTRHTYENSIAALAATLQDSRVDLNPHQVEAALFALRSPYSRGIIEADEVGLGKTIVAGIVVAQKWAEDKRRILIIVPANLRRQWQLELQEKFDLHSVIMEGDTFKVLSKTQENPFLLDEIIITSYNFAHAKADFIKAIDWDICVIDEAHKLRNVYKPDNVMARSIHEALRNCYKLLLTATPLQNSLLELYGLVSFIDEYTFGDIDSFKSQFANMRDENQREFSDLAERMKTLCTRTLRRQVLEYIKYTERLLITQEFTPTPAEQEFYDKFSVYLQRENLWALPSGRGLMNLILWKLLASSTFAIAGTLAVLIERLEEMHKSGKYKTRVSLNLGDDLPLSDYEDESATAIKGKGLSDEELISLKAEIEELKGYYTLAANIKRNAKGEALLTALQSGFAKLKSIKAPQKAVVFTESRRTQLYLAGLLEKSRLKGKFTLYHGGLTPKKQAEIIDAFRGETQILIATESAAEGMNLQFCPMVVNYDLPWNPQRIEQRIGRCHRYGQKHDVVVVNFLNQSNLADQRVYQLLCDKFQLFEGVFGASDSILGAIDALDFERRIAEIYSRCRTAKEIEKSFADLQESLAPQIDAEMSKVKQKLLENFDEEVIRRLKVDHDTSADFMSKFENMMWLIAKHKLDKYGTFDDENRRFTITAVWKKNPYYNSRYGYKRLWGEYEMSKTAPLDKRYRFKGALAQTLIYDCINSAWRTGSVVFESGGKLKPLVGKSGYLTLYNMEVIYNNRRENHLVFAGFCENGKALSHTQIQRMFELSGTNETGYHSTEDMSDKLNVLYETEQTRLMLELDAANTRYFEHESVKLTKWTNDIKLKIERKLRTMDRSIDELNAELKGRRVTLPRRIEIEEQIAELESRKKSLHMRIFEEQSKVDEERDALIEQTKAKLTRRIESKHIFSIKWRLV